MKTLILLTACVALVAYLVPDADSPVAGNGPDAAQVRESYRKSYAGEKAKDYAGAMAAIESLPADYLRELRLGWLCYLSANAPRAEEHYRAAIKAEPNSVEARLGYTLVLTAQERFADTETVARQVIELDALNYYANLRLAYALRMQKKYPQADEVAERMARFYPADAGVLAEQATLAAAQGRPAKSLPAQETLNGYAASYQAETAMRYAEAIKAMGPLIQANAVDYAANLRLGWLYYLNGEYVDSLRHYALAVKASPVSIEARLGFTLPLMARAQYVELEKATRQILAADPGNYYANLRLAFALRMQKKPDQAETAAKALLGRYPTDVSVLTELALVRVAQDQKEEAARWFERILILDPDNATAKQQLLKAPAAR
ncbi:MAG: tetratricopeptide repeat protein [Tepidisphaeraceae bacterium]